MNSFKQKQETKINVQTNISCLTLQKETKTRVIYKIQSMLKQQPLMEYGTESQNVGILTCATTDKQESTMPDLQTSKIKFGFFIMFIQNLSGKLKRTKIQT